MNSDSLQATAPELHAMLSRAPRMPKVKPLLPSETLMLPMRDGVHLATDLYLPAQLPAPVIVLRSPYLRAHHAPAFAEFVNEGFAVVAQDCRGTGDSEPDRWDYYVHEREDSYDCVDWIASHHWYDGFIGGVGTSYNAQMQFCMAMHPKMSAIAPEVGGLGAAFRPARKYMFFEAYAKTVGKGVGKVAVHFYEMERQTFSETLAGGYFNEPIEAEIPQTLLDRYPSLTDLTPVKARHWLWRHYTTLGALERADFIRLALCANEVSILEIEALPRIFGQHIAHDAHTLPAVDPAEIVRALNAPALMITGWYDWSLGDTLATWKLMTEASVAAIGPNNRLLITPSAHNMAGYHEGLADHPELARTYRLSDITDLLVAWNRAVAAEALSEWPRVVFYLMGANEWRCASSWPPREASMVALYLREGGALAWEPDADSCAPDSYVYDPADPTPTLGGSIVSGVIPPGSVDVRDAQDRSDVLVYTSPVLDQPIDVVGPLEATLFATSSALDTDFVVRLSDVFPDGRAIQLQSSLCRTRYRAAGRPPELLVPGKIYEFEVDMWAIANRFEAGHRIRIDVTSADFPRFERNSNRGGTDGPPIAATQSIYRDREHPSRINLPIMRCEKSIKLPGGQNEA